MEQDEIVTTPRGKVVFQFQGGVRGFAQITQSPEGTPGTQGASIVTSIQNAERTLDVRRAVGRTTQHQIRIQCCVDSQGNTCRRWRDAVAAPEDLGMSADAPSEPRSGPSAPDAENPPTEGGTGGPRMEVRE